MPGIGTPSAELLALVEASCPQLLQAIWTSLYRVLMACSSAAPLE